MDVEAAIRARRTVKAFAPEPVDRATLTELLELARWAPNHRLTNPWRFRVIGPRALTALKDAEAARASAEAAAAGADPVQIATAARAKLDRAPTLIACSATLTGDPATDTEDRHAAACAVYIVLLAAHARGLAGYWRTPTILGEPAGRDAVAIPAGEEFVALIHLGRPARTGRDSSAPGADAPARAPVERYVTFLD